MTTAPTSSHEVQQANPSKHDEASSDSSLWRLVGLALLAVALPGLAVVLGLTTGMETVTETLQTIREHAWIGALVIVVAGAMACGLALLPTHGLSLVSGYLLGSMWGALAAILAVTLASGIGWWITRGLTGQRLRAVIGRSKAGRSLSQVMIDSQGFRAVLAVALVRLPPQVPFALGNVLASSAGVRLGALLLGTALGMLPRVAVVAWAGSQLTEINSWRDGGWALLGLTSAMVALVVLGAWSWRVISRDRQADAD